MILRLIALWTSAATALLVHALLGIPGDYLGQGYPQYPGLTVTVLELGLMALAATLPIPLVAATAHWVGLRWLALPPVILLWLWAASVMIQPFAIDFGTTWRGTEALRELFLHRVHTPLALLTLIAVSAWTLAPRRA